MFAQQVAEDGTPGYWSLLIVHKDSPLNSLEDVKRQAKSLTLGIGDPNSTSGFLVPGYYVMAQNGLDPKTSFKRDALRQPRDQPAGGGQQAGRRGHQQQREHGEVRAPQPGEGRRDQA